MAILIERSEPDQYGQTDVRFDCGGLRVTAARRLNVRAGVSFWEVYIKSPGDYLDIQGAETLIAMLQAAIREARDLEESAPALHA